MVAGIIKNNICLAVEEKCPTIFLSSFTAAAMAGKAATAKEIPKIPMGKDCKLLAKLNTDNDPADNLEAIMVITTKLICDIAKLIVRGIIILKIAIKFLSFQFKNNLKRYPKP